ncbi:transposase [Candidatus Bipolaricaulota bacterium]|nr:transposase [Candidatus Bipolaricaulota bacterium]
MATFDIEPTDEILPTQSGLALLGLLLSKTNLTEKLNQLPTETGVKPEIPHSDIAKSYMGLLVQGKSNFDHIEAFRGDPFFKKSLDMEEVPSSSTLRQRLDKAEDKWKDVVLEESARLIKKSGMEITPCFDNYLSVDVDVCPFYNSDTKKEGVSHTYKVVDGYAPIFAYLGKEGYGINTELREGKAHCQKGTPKHLLGFANPYY